MATYRALSKFILTTKTNRIMNSENKKNKTESPENDKLHRQKFVLAIIIFIAYLIFVVYLITQTKTKDD